VTEAKLTGSRRYLPGLHQRGSTVLEVAIGALAAQPGCASVIAGATSPEQVKANAAAADWIPSATELAELDRLVPPPGAD
jgi:aryl-alcohol dehydrogenase-like predicted oxidoreductase